VAGQNIPGTMFRGASEKVAHQSLLQPDSGAEDREGRGSDISYTAEHPYAVWEKAGAGGEAGGDLGGHVPERGWL